MNRRFWIICSVIGFGLLTLSVLGLSSLGMHRKGLQAERQQEFMAVAKQISFDVKKKVDTFVMAEQGRPYTDFQPYYVPEIGNQTAALVPSPLANLYFNDFATGYFQLDSDGQLTSPHFAEQQTQKAKKPVNHSEYFDNVRQNLLPSLQNGQTVATHRIEPAEREKMDKYRFDEVSLFKSLERRSSRRVSEPESSSAVMKEFDETLTNAVEQAAETKGLTQQTQVSSKSKRAPSKRSVHQISTQEENQQPTQVFRQRRDNYEVNVTSNTVQLNEEPVSQAVESYNRSRIASQSSLQREQQSSFDLSSQSEKKDTRSAEDIAQPMDEGMDAMMMVQTFRGVDADTQKKNEQQQIEQADTVQVRIEPFVPMTVPDSSGNNGIFSGQVFLLRHVQIEDRHFVQGFRLNEDELMSQITESAQKLTRRGMGYEISRSERPDAAHTAILQFDFGEVVLNLLELEPGLIQAQVVRIRNWFFGILGVVWLSVLVAMVALWKNLQQQVQLSRKKDDFISAVSHELRTPLTSIRMYTEMLEKDWVKTDGKRREYYTTMRTESERLTRLIENVLDFSRIQRGKKRYDFMVGDVNECIGDVADIMRPYAQRAGFVLEQRFEVLDAFAFDRDAVTQIVINLVDNALKYAKDAEDKHIIIRTRKQKDYAVIEVEDHGSGIPRSQQKKIFDAFYRSEDESTRQSTGTGLGLALVKRFAEAHSGYVEIATVKPTGALFRVGLAT